MLALILPFIFPLSLSLVFWTSRGRLHSHFVREKKKISEPSNPLTSLRAKLS